MNNVNFSQLSDSAKEKHREQFHEIVSNLQEGKMSYGSMFIRHLVFMNGGALVAVLSAKAALFSNQLKNVDWTFWPMVFFSVGLVLVALMNLIIFFRYGWATQKVFDSYRSFFKDETNHQKFREELNLLETRVGQRRRLENSLGFLGLFCFILGAVSGIYNFA